MKCMNVECKHEWTYVFCIKNFTQSFVNKQLRKHRESIFYETEKALLPDAQAALETINEVKAVVKPLEELLTKANTDSQEIFNQLVASQTIPNPEAYFMRHKNKTFNRQLCVQFMKSSLRMTADAPTRQLIKRECCELNRLHYSATQIAAEIRNLQTRINNIAEGINQPQSITRKEFIRPCPGTDCRGYLSTQWKCGLCHIKVCSKCHIRKPDNDGAEGAPEHTCKPDDVATAELITKETKQCPRCATPIYKITGCDQMWCTQCNTAFDWRTGSVVNGTIHNPHYFEWMRTRNNNIPERNPMDIICGRELDHRIVTLVLSLVSRNGTTNETRTILDNIGSNLLFIKEIIEIDYNVLDMMNNRKMRIKYLNQEISEPDFKRQVFLKWRHNEINRELRNALILFRDVATELVYNLLETINNTRPSNESFLKTKEGVDTFLAEIEAIQELVLKELKPIGDIFHIKPRHFNVKISNASWLYALKPVV